MEIVIGGRFQPVLSVLLEKARIAHSPRCRAFSIVFSLTPAEKEMIGCEIRDALSRPIRVRTKDHHLLGRINSWSYQNDHLVLECGAEIIEVESDVRVCIVTWHLVDSIACQELVMEVNVNLTDMEKMEAERDNYGSSLKIMRDGIVHEFSGNWQPKVTHLSHTDDPNYRRIVFRISHSKLYKRS